METITITAHTANNTQIVAIKAFMKALKIKFEVSKEIAKEVTENISKEATEETESPYDPEFVKKILNGDKQRAEGKSRIVTLEELDNLWK